MTSGLLDVPAPLLQWLDDRVSSVLPAPVSIAVLAVLAGVFCLELYRLASPQKRIGRVKRDAKQAQQALAAYDGEMEGAWPLIKSMLGLSLQRVAIVLPATLVAAYPVVALLLWLGTTYGHVMPPRGESVAVDAPAPMEAQWLHAEAGAPPRIQARQPGGNVILELPMLAAIPVIHKRRWWNGLTENPAGYLPDDGPVDTIVIDLPKRELHSIGPRWLRGWEAIFLPVLFVAALAYKTVRRID